MKNLLLLVAAIGCLAFTGCDKDNNEIIGSGELVGSTWSYSEGSILGSYWQEEIEFISANKFSYSYFEANKGTITDEGKSTGSYTYIPPIITGTISMDGVKVSMRGEVDGKSMVVYINDEYYATYTKQKN